MIRARQKQSQRGAGGALGAELPIPLPTRGVLSKSESSEISGLFCHDLSGWQSNGMTLEAVQKIKRIEAVSPLFRERVPFEFNGEFKYLENEGDRVRFDGRMQYFRMGDIRGRANISSHVLMLTDDMGPVTFDGTDLKPRTFKTDTGFDPREFTGVTSHFDILYFWKAGGALDFYYGEVGEIQGNLTRFPLGRLGNVTGSIIGARSLTLDANDGIRNIFCVFTSTGEMVAYAGSNPSFVDSWDIYARVKTAPIVSQDAFVHVGADLWMLTTAGVVSVPQTLRRGHMALVNTVSEPVRREIQRALREPHDWQMHYTADGSDVIINQVSDAGAKQYVYRTESQAWTTETMPIRQWHNLGPLTQATGLNGDLYDYNGLGVEGGDPVKTVWETSWFRMPRRGGMTYLRPTVIATGPLTFKVTVFTDHDDEGVDVLESVQVVEIKPDNPGDRVAINEEIGVDAVGQAFKIRFEVEAEWAEFTNLTAGLI